MLVLAVAHGAGTAGRFDVGDNHLVALVRLG